MNHPVPYTILSNTMCTTLKKKHQKSGMQHICNEADNAFFAKRVEKSNFSLWPVWQWCTIYLLQGTWDYSYQAPH